MQNRTVITLNGANKEQMIMLKQNDLNNAFASFQSNMSKHE